MEKNAQHTPTPWHTGEGKAERIIYAADGFAVADATVFHGLHVESPTANAAFIVRACNAHDELVAALKGLLDDMRDIRGIDPEEYKPESFAAARAALAKVGA